MKNFFTKVILSLGLCCGLNCAVAQMIYLEGAQVSGNVSTKVNAEGAVSSRIIVNSPIKVTYDTNMKDISPENIYSGITNEMISDTIYFFLNINDNSRILYINADGYTTASTGALKLTPKSTYIYTVTIPTGYSQLVDSGRKASSEHKYDIAAGFYRQALTAEEAPEDKSALQGYIETMDKCNEHLSYAKKYLIAAKKMKEEGGAKADLMQLKQYYEDALSAYNGIKGYMMDDKYDVIIGKIKAAISALPAMIIEGVVEDATNTMVKLEGVKVYGMRSQSDKDPVLLTTSVANGRFRVELSNSEKYSYKILLFNPEDIKGYKRTKEIDMSTIHDFSKLRIKIFK